MARTDNFNAEIYGPWNDEETHHPTDFKINVNIRKDEPAPKPRTKLNVGTLVFGRLQSLEVKKLERAKRKDLNRLSVQPRKLEPQPSWLPEIIQFSRIQQPQVRESSESLIK